MLMTNKSNRLPQSIMQAAQDLETTRRELELRTTKLAIKIALIASIIAIVTSVAFLVSTFYRTEPEPVVIEVDKSTGISNIHRSLKDTQDKYDESINRHFITEYVNYRENYDWFTISAQSEAVKLMSEPNVYQEYSNLISSKNSALEILKDKGRLKVEILSVTPLEYLYQVRYTTQQVTPTGDPIPSAPITNWIATMAFDYDAKLKMTELQRHINPLGFKVASYKTNQEVNK